MARSTSSRSRMTWFAQSRSAFRRYANRKAGSLDDDVRGGDEAYITYTWQRIVEMLKYGSLRTVHNNIIGSARDYANICSFRALNSNCCQLYRIQSINCINSFACLWNFLHVCSLLDGTMVEDKAVSFVLTKHNLWKQIAFSRKRIELLFWFEPYWQNFQEHRCWRKQNNMAFFQPPLLIIARSAYAIWLVTSVTEAIMF